MSEYGIPPGTVMLWRCPRPIESCFSRKPPCSHTEAHRCGSSCVRFRGVDCLSCVPCGFRADRDFDYLRGACPWCRWYCAEEPVQSDALACDECDDDGSKWERREK